MILRKVKPGADVRAEDHNSLVEYLQNYKIKGDGKTIRVKNYGGTAIITSDASDASAYAGYFLVTDFSNESVTRISIAPGECLVNDEWFTMPEYIVNISADEYVYLECIYIPPVLDEFGDVLTEGYLIEPTINTSMLLPEYEDNKFKVIIANIETEIIESKLTITNIIQQQHGMIIGYVFDKLGGDIGGGPGGEGKIIYVRSGGGYPGPSGSGGSGGITGGGDPGSGTDDDVWNEWVDDYVDDEEAGGESTEETPPRKQKLAIQDGSPMGTTMRQVCGDFDSACGEGKNCVSSGREIVMAGTQDSIQKRMAAYESSDFRDAKCKSISSKFSGSCGSAVNLSAVNSEDGEKWTVSFTLCCCEKTEDDDEEELGTCDEGEENCEGDMECAAMPAAKSISYANYESCNSGRIGMLSMDGMENVCETGNIEEPTYNGACGYINATPCQMEEGLWNFDYTVCCCELVTCPDYAGSSIHNIYDNDLGVWMKATNNTTCSQLVIGNIIGDGYAQNCQWSQYGYYADTTGGEAYYHSEQSGIPTMYTQWRMYPTGYHFLPPGGWFLLKWTKVTSFEPPPERGWTEASIDMNGDNRITYTSGTL